jgi:hypothetical protein
MTAIKSIPSNTDESGAVSVLQEPAEDLQIFGHVISRQISHLALLATVMLWKAASSLGRGYLSGYASANPLRESIQLLKPPNPPASPV